MSRKKPFGLVFGAVFTLTAVIFWQSSEIAFYGFMAAIVEGDREGSVYFLGWLAGNGLPAALVACIVSFAAAQRHDAKPDADSSGEFGTE